MIGTRSTVLQTFRSPRTVQNGFDRRSMRISGFCSGIFHLPSFRKRSTRPMWAEDSLGR